MNICKKNIWDNNLIFFLKNLKRKLLNEYYYIKYINHKYYKKY